MLSEPKPRQRRGESKHLAFCPQQLNCRNHRPAQQPWNL